MTVQLSDRVQTIKPSPTLAVTNRAAEMRAAGHDIIGLGAGEPDFDTPQHIKEAAIAALNRGLTKYTAVEGTPSLKKAIVEKFARENQLTYTAKQILVSVGGKHSFYNLAQALLNPGDEVIIPAPYWVSYPDMCLLAGAVPVIVSAGIEQNFKLTPEQIAAAITDKTRLFVLNSPSNPTGVHYTNEELAALGKMLLNYPHVLVATDDMYEHILWEGMPFKNILNFTPELYERTIVLNGVSKAYAMTGWRIGYAAGPEPLIKAMGNIQSQSTSNPTSIAQYAAEAALNGDQSFIADMVKVFKERHDFVLSELLKIDGVRCSPCQGTFYIFPSFEGVIARMGMKDDLALAEYLIEKAGVALVPGSAFGAPGYGRISFATSMENLQKAMQRLQTALA
ncbi:pyridoxal phosphate-dependent aminotransferase [Thioflexithrix psekupsensis]|uniref:Aminotransferase n=1 Tax=Thioflexithrix psekupsensis TaxID=1570016 RepID=A0A251X6R9_9GAMM|nr:pyridoxal phosphate-dependent aminotransferase [Thioflexithrix psekupsensis]OUD13769.1 aspartate aminotransferase [Thioflexithrix psekupsensis]